MQVPFIIFTDFESFLCKAEGPENVKSPLHFYERYIQSGFAYLVISTDPHRTFDSITYRGPDIIEEFLKRLKTESDSITTF